MDGDGFLYDDPKLLTQLRAPDEINRQIEQGINTISHNPKNSARFGSWIYKSQLYSGDIDLTSIEAHCCDIPTATKQFVKDTQNIVKKIQKTKSHYIGDIKAGIDQALIIDIGDLSFSRTGKPSITGYNRETVAFAIKQLYRDGLINSKEYEEIMKYVIENIDLEQWEKLYAVLRDKWLLRWSPAEILKGVKKLSGNRKITLGEAINQHTMTKIDMWAKVNERFIEYSNVLTYYMVDKQGNKTLLNYVNVPEGIQEGLKKEVEKYAFSIKDFKPFKMIKRMWSMARTNKDYKMIELLTPLMQTDLGRLSQINSDLEVLIGIIKNVKSPPMASIMQEIDNLKWRIGNIFEINIEPQAVIKDLNYILSKNKNTAKNKKELIKFLEALQTFFKQTINREALRALKNMGLYPPPSSYLPDNMSGSGFWGDFWEGFKMPFKAINSVIPISSLVSTINPVAGLAVKALGGCDNPDSPNCPKKRDKKKNQKDNKGDMLRDLIGNI